MCDYSVDSHTPNSKQSASHALMSLSHIIESDLWKLFVKPGLMAVMYREIVFYCHHLIWLILFINCFIRIYCFSPFLFLSLGN